MIYGFLVDCDNSGDLYRMSIESEDLQAVARELLKYSNDVRYIGAKESCGKKDKGQRVMQCGAIIRRCQYFGCKVGYKMRFQTSEYKLNTIKQAVDARELIGNGC